MKTWVCLLALFGVALCSEVEEPKGAPAPEKIFTWQGVSFDSKPSDVKKEEPKKECEDCGITVPNYLQFPSCPCAPCQPCCDSCCCDPCNCTCVKVATCCKPCGPYKLPTTCTTCCKKSSPSRGKCITCCKPCTTCCRTTCSRICAPCYRTCAPCCRPTTYLISREPCIPMLNWRAVLPVACNSCGPVGCNSCGPVACNSCGPVAYPCGPVPYPCGPVAYPCGPVAYPCGPVACCSPYSCRNYFNYRRVIPNAYPNYTPCYSCRAAPCSYPVYTPCARPCCLRVPCPPCLRHCYRPC